jgi:hypothetical protein
MNVITWLTRGATISATPEKDAKEIPPAKHVGQNQWSETSLKGLLKAGRDE